MATEQGVPWWQRVLAVSAAMGFTVALGITLVVLRDSKRNTDFHWGNGGEEQIVGIFLLAATFSLLPTLLFVILPAILLTPVYFQRRRWLAMLGLAALVPLLVEGLLLWQSHVGIWREARVSSWLYVGPELFALICCAEYLLLLRWLEAKNRSPQSLKPCEIHLCVDRLG